MEILAYWNQQTIRKVAVYALKFGPICEHYSPLGICTSSLKTLCCHIYFQRQAGIGGIWQVGPCCQISWPGFHQIFPRFRYRHWYVALMSIDTKYHESVSQFHSSLNSKIKKKIIKKIVHRMCVKMFFMQVNWLLLVMIYDILCMSYLPTLLVRKAKDAPRACATDRCGLSPGTCQDNLVAKNDTNFVIAHGSSMVGEVFLWRGSCR